MANHRRKRTLNQIISDCAEKAGPILNKSLSPKSIAAQLSGQAGQPRIEEGECSMQKQTRFSEPEIASWVADHNDDDDIEEILMEEGKNNIVSILSRHAAATDRGVFLSRIHLRKEYWYKNMELHLTIVSILENGLNLPVIKKVPDFFIPNNLSAKQNSDFVNEEITNMLRSGSIRKAATMPKGATP